MSGCEADANAFLRPKLCLSEASSNGKESSKYLHIGIFGKRIFFYQKLTVFESHSDPQDDNNFLLFFLKNLDFVLINWKICQQIRKKSFDVVHSLGKFSLF